MTWTAKKRRPSKSLHNSGGGGSKMLWYLVQVGHKVLVERADQHVKSPLTLLGKSWRLQCGFLSIDY